MGSSPLLLETLLEIRPQVFVAAEDGTAFHAARQQDAIDVFYVFRQTVGIVFQAFFAGGIVVVVVVADELVRLGIVLKVAADDDADVVEFEALGGVDAADLVLAAVVDGPAVLVMAAVPRTGEAKFGDVDVGDVRVGIFLLRRPLPCVAREHTRFEALRVLSST